MLRQNSIQKIIQNNFCMVNSIQNSIQNFEISWIQFNKIFIQFENVGIDHGYSLTDWLRKREKLEKNNVGAFPKPPSYIVVQKLCGRMNYT